MKRIPILFLLMALLAACGGTDATPSATATATDATTAEATASPEPSDEPSTEPDPSDDSGDETALAELIPDELNGVARTDIPGMDQIIANALAAQGMDAGEAEFVFASYGDAATGVVITAFRIPGVGEAQLETLARMMSGAGGAQGVESETVELGGKSVHRISSSAAGQQSAAYLYFAEGAAFSIVSGDEASVEQLLEELP